MDSALFPNPGRRLGHLSLFKNSHDLLAIVTYLARMNCYITRLKIPVKYNDRAGLFHYPLQQTWLTHLFIALSKPC